MLLLCHLKIIKNQTYIKMAETIRKKKGIYYLLTDKVMEYMFVY